MRFPFGHVNFTNTSIRKNFWILPVIYFAIITVLIYGLKIRPILFNDDWCHLVNVQAQNFSMLYERRPLHTFLLWLLTQYLPAHLSIKAIYFLQVLILYLTTLSVFFLVKRLLNNSTWMSFVAALLFLVYPSDYTRLYITTSGIRLSLLFLFFGLILFDSVFRKNTLINLFAIFPLFITSFLMYEGQLGLAIIWPLVLIIVFRQKITAKNIVGLLAYYSVICIFIVWRLIIHPMFYVDIKLGYLDDINVDVIVANYFKGIRTIFAGFSFPHHNFNWLTLVNVVIIVVILLLLLVAFLITNRLINQQVLEVDHRETLKSNIYIFLAGVLIWIAGYVPIILNYPPNIYGHLSRVNIFSMLGAILMVLSVIYSGFLLLRIDHILSAKLTSILVLLLVLFGAVIQLQVQDAYNSSWLASKEFYSAMFEKVPDIEKGTHIVLLLSGYKIDDGLSRPLFSSSWESLCIFQTLYEKDLKISYRYDQRKTSDFPSENSLNSILETDTVPQLNDLSILLVLKYNNSTKVLDIQQDINDLVSDALFGEYSPEDRILPLLEPVVARKLVE